MYSLINTFIFFYSEGEVKQINVVLRLWGKSETIQQAIEDFRYRRTHLYTEPSWKSDQKAEKARL